MKEIMEPKHWKRYDKGRVNMEAKVLMQDNKNHTKLFSEEGKDLWRNRFV